MITSTDIGTLITRNPNIRGGRPIIAGTGVTVRRIAVYSKMGLSPEEIVDVFGHITLAQVYAALAYYHANRDEIEADLAEEEEAAKAAEEAERARKKV
ncbi:MAG TPA: DUF433 domain-containing protein [Anaerolineae bacterium]|nr:DUF433 domain-containing protein [Anaerolineae bacterium]